MAKRDFISKLASSMVDGDISKGANFNQFQFYKYHLKNMQKKNAPAFFTLKKQWRTLLEDGKMLVDEY